jgi:hypothetical protein
MGPGAHEIVAPHVIRPFRPQPNARSIAQPQPSSWPLFLRHFQPLTSPDALDAIPAHMPACLLQQHRDSPVAKATVFTGQLGDRFCQCIFVGSLRRLVALRCTPLPDQPARVPFAYPMSLARVLDCRPSKSRLVGRSQWVDATADRSPTCRCFNGWIRSRASLQRKRCPV